MQGQGQGQGLHLQLSQQFTCPKAVTHPSTNPTGLDVEQLR